MHNVITCPAEIKEKNIRLYWLNILTFIKYYMRRNLSLEMEGTL